MREESRFLISNSIPAFYIDKARMIDKTKMVSGEFFAILLWNLAVLRFVQQVPPVVVRAVLIPPRKDTDDVDCHFGTGI
jgi:hypothetical protein